MRGVRPAAVAGLFYPEGQKALEAELRRLTASVPPPSHAAPPKALIVPHAGYIYSGPIAARAYSCLKGADRIRRVVLLGPVHRVPVQGLALPTAACFATPLGTVELDTATISHLRSMPQVGVSDRAHQWEHSLEVQIPFLQFYLKNFKLVPLAVGDASATEVADVLAAAWGGDETLIVVSSDLSHYHSYEVAKGVDRISADAVLGLRPEGLEDEGACGAVPVRGLLLAARRKGLVAELLDLRNSGDTAGDRERVVGYGAFAFRAPEKEMAYA
ncbi:MAG: AmmeMemoRadiSam system protein B [Nitrospirota bacterium]|nr:AmmeMemoRadiSam system protein B [Nitrospirota bacterium]